jgi:tetratricopeptide (TPR) repeat protein
MKIISSVLLVTLLVGCSSHNSKLKNPENTEDGTKKLTELIEKARGNKQTTQYLADGLFLKANMSLLDGDYFTASVLFQHLSSLMPDDEFIQKKYAVSLIRVNDLEKALTVLEKLYKTSHDDKVGLILAGVYISLDKEAAARDVYQQLITRDPKNEDACVFLGKSYALSKEVPRAISLLQGCSKRDSKNGMYDYYIGKIQIDQGKIKEAMASFRSAHKKQPTLSLAVNALGILLEEREQQDEAIKLYQAHLKKAPSDSAILGRLVQLLFVKEQYKEVIPYAEKLTDLEPENLNLKVKLGILYTDTKRYQEAISIFNDLLATAPQSDKILYYLGAIHQEMNNLEKSIEYFNQIPPQSGLYTDSSVQMANMLSTLATNEAVSSDESIWKEAFLKHVNGKVEELKDLRVEFSVIKAGFYENLAHYTKAMEAMMVVQDESGFTIQHKYYLANLFEKEKKYEESTALIMSILEKEPKNAHAWNFLGYSVLMRGNEMERAYSYIQKAFAINPDDGYIRDSLGWYFFKKGDVTRALSELQLALKKVPGDVEILKHLAIVHHELKDYSKSKTFFQDALKHARAYNEKKEIAATMESYDNARSPASAK